MLQLEELLGGHHGGHGLFVGLLHGLLELVVVVGAIVVWATCWNIVLLSMRRHLLALLVVEFD